MPQAKRNNARAICLQASVNNTMINNAARMSAGEEHNALIGGFAINW